MSKKACLSTNWRQKGYDNVYKNKPWKQKLDKYQKICGKKGVAVNKDHYLNGVRTAGSEICTSYKSFASNDSYGGWPGVGYRDAVVGERSKNEHYEFACSKFAVKVDNKSYKAGYVSGLKLFCTKKNAFKFGQSGKTYQDTCTGANARTFKRAYNIGLT